MRYCHPEDDPPAGGEDEGSRQWISAFAEITYRYEIPLRQNFC
jgi:hypothetical protein